MRSLYERLPKKDAGDIVLISSDEEFAQRFQSFHFQDSDTECGLTVIKNPLSALVHLLESHARVVVYDVDTDDPERNSAALRAIRLICRDVPIILSAKSHLMTPFPHDDDVGVFYRIVKSAPDSELHAAIESAWRSHRRSRPVL